MIPSEDDPLLGSDLAERFGDQFEMLLSFLSERHPWLTPDEALRNQAAFVKVSKSIAELISARTAQAWGSGLPSWLRDMVRIWHTTGSTIVPLNYDLLIEIVTSAELDHGAIRSAADPYPIALISAYERDGMSGYKTPVASSTRYQGSHSKMSDHRMRSRRDRITGSWVTRSR
jgi:hypothetical protein